MIEVMNWTEGEGNLSEEVAIIPNSRSAWMAETGDSRGFGVSYMTGQLGEAVGMLVGMSRII